MAGGTAAPDRARAVAATVRTTDADPSDSPSSQPAMTWRPMARNTRLGECTPSSRLAAATASRATRTAAETTEERPSDMPAAMPSQSLRPAACAAPCCVPMPEAAARAKGLAEALGVDHLLGSMPATLSVGERQRAAIVRALTPGPQLILADEPTAALDPVHAARVMDAFLMALEFHQGSLVLVTHNADWARRGGLAELAFRMEEDDEGVTAVLDDDNAHAEAAPC